MSRMIGGGMDDHSDASGASPGEGAAWRAYQAAAQRMDAGRRAAAAEAGQQAAAARAARNELALLRARLAALHFRLRELGVAAAELRPADADVRAAAQRLAGGPYAVSAILRRASAMVDSAEALALGSAAAQPLAAGRVRLRNLLVYGPFALVALAVQLLLYLLAGAEVTRTSAFACGLSTAVAAFGLGFLTVGLAFPPGPDGRVERTPLLGAAACVGPALATCLAAAVWLSG